MSSSGSWEECGECLGDSTLTPLTDTLGRMLGREKRWVGRLASARGLDARPGAGFSHMGQSREHLAGRSLTRSMFRGTGDWDGLQGEDVGAQHISLLSVHWLSRLGGTHGYPGFMRQLLEVCAECISHMSHTQGNCRAR